MGEMIWVEILDRHRSVLARFRCAGPEVKIGRAYDNEVVIDDPFVAPHHLRVFADETGKLMVEDLATANGMFVDNAKSRVDRIELTGEATLHIGKSLLRVRAAHHAVAPERVADPQEREWPLMLAVGLGIIALELLNVWLSETTEAKLTAYLLPTLIIPLFVLGWVGFCAVLSRIFAGHAMFEVHLRIALLGVLAISLYNEILAYTGFALSSPLLVKYEYAGMWTIAAIMCYFHLRAIGPARMWFKGGLIATLALTAILMTALSQSEARTQSDQPNYVYYLKPPEFRLTPTRSEQEFFSRAGALKEKLERARGEESPAGGSAAEFELDD